MPCADLQRKDKLQLCHVYCERNPAANMQCASSLGGQQTALLGIATCAACIAPPVGFVN